MSQGTRVAEAVAVPAPNRQMRRHPIDPDQLSNTPTRKGRTGALEFYAEIGVHGVTSTRIRTAGEQGELRKFKIAGHNWYADRDLWDFLQALASGGQGGAA